MRKYLPAVIISAFAALFVATFAGAQPGIGITKSAPLTGRGSSGDPLKITVCSNGQVYQSNGTSWVCTTPSAGAGDIEGVTAGSGLINGGTTGTVVLDVAVGAGLSVSADAVNLALTEQNCSAGEFFDSNTAAGVFSCVAEVGDISTVTTTANMGLTGGGTSGAVTVGLLSTCADGQVLKSGGTGTTWTCADDTGTTYTGGDGLDLTAGDFDVDPGAGLIINGSDEVALRADCSDGQVLVSGGTGTTWTCAAAGAGDITGVTVTSPACSAGSYMTTLTGGAASGDAPVGGTCTAEVGDVSNVSVTAPISGGGASGSVTIGLTACADTQIYKMSGASWACAADSGGTSYTAGDGLTLTVADFDLTYTSDFTITTDQLDLSTAVTAPGTLAVAGAFSVNGGSTSTLSGGLALSQAADTYVYNSLATGAGNQNLNLYAAGTGIVRVNGNTGSVTNAGTGGLIVYPGANSSTAAVTLAASGLGTFAGGVTTPVNLTTTGTGDVVSGDALTVAGNATIGDTSASDTHTINGTVNIDGASASTSVYLRDGSFNCNFEDNSTSTCYINQFGYNGGTTQYRNLTVNNGNGGSIARFNAATTLTEMFGAATITGILTVNNDTFLGNTNTASHQIYGKVYHLGTAPTLSGCTGTCTMASYSSDARGRITCTDESGSNCTVTFSVGFSTNAPACSITYEDATAPTAAPYVYSVSTSAFVFDQVGGAQAHNYSYHCDGMI